SRIAGLSGSCHDSQLASCSYRQLDGCRVHTCDSSDHWYPSTPATTVRGHSLLTAGNDGPILVERIDRRRTSVLRRRVAGSCRDSRESGEPVGTAERLCSGSRGERCLYRRPPLWRRHALYKKCR